MTCMSRLQLMGNENDMKLTWMLQFVKCFSKQRTCIILNRDYLVTSPASKVWTKMRFCRKALKPCHYTIPLLYHTHEKYSKKDKCCSFSYSTDSFVAVTSLYDAVSKEWRYKRCCWESVDVNDDLQWNYTPVNTLCLDQCGGLCVSAGFK